MKQQLLFILLALLFISCNNTEPVGMELECTSHDEVYPPVGYKLTELGNIDFDGELKDFQFLNDSVGYALMVRPDQFSQVFKTVDGGKNWNSLNSGFDEFAKSICFVNENIGIVSTQGGSHCPLQITNDGGETWTRKVVENLGGQIVKLISNEEGIIFGRMLKGYGQICKSEDDGNSWELIIDSEELDIRFNGLFGFKIIDDFVVVENTGGELIKFDFQGDIVSRIKTYSNVAQDVQFLDSDEIIVSCADRLIKSENGGVAWFTLMHRRNKMIGFDSNDEGILLAGGEHCNNTPFGSDALFISTTTGGEQWNNHFNLTTNLLFNFRGSYPTERDSYYFFVDNKQYVLEKE